VSKLANRGCNKSLHGILDAYDVVLIMDTHTVEFEGGIVTSSVDGILLRSLRTKRAWRKGRAIGGGRNNRDDHHPHVKIEVLVGEDLGSYRNSIVGLKP